MEATQITKPTKFAVFVQILEDGSPFTCELPISENFNDGTGVMFYKKQGLLPIAEYHSMKAEKAAKEAADKEVKKADKK